MNNISINDNWNISVLVLVLIIFLIYKIYESINDTDMNNANVVTQTKNIL